MAEALLFKFEGNFAQQNKMDFYELARFQYAASRLAAKLAQFRRIGRFQKKITNNFETDIFIHPYKAGSFELNIEFPDVENAEYYLNSPLTALWIFLSDLIFSSTDNLTAIDLIDSTSLKYEFDEIVNDGIFKSQEAIDLLNKRLIDMVGFEEGGRLLLDRLQAEVNRRAYLEAHRDLFSSISPEDLAKLITMAAPLLRELAVPMRKSAKRVLVRSVDRFGTTDFLAENRRTTELIQTIETDDKITQHQINIIQYNKETGWGKFRSNQWAGTPSFNIINDKKDRVNDLLIDGMHDQSVVVDTYVVYSKSREPIRLIVSELVHDGDPAF